MRGATALLLAWQIEHVQLSGAITVSLSDRFIEDPAIDGPINGSLKYDSMENRHALLFS